MPIDEQREPFVCAACSAPSTSDGACTRCEGTLVPVRELPQWGLRARTDARPIVTTRGALHHTGAYILPFSALLGAAAFTRRGDAVLGLGLAALVALAYAVYVVMGLRAARSWLVDGDALMLRAREDRSMALSCDADDGSLVSVRGFVRTRTPTVTATGERCAASQTSTRSRREGPDFVVTRGPMNTPVPTDGTLVRESRGGVFALEGPDGNVVATVAGEHVLLAHDGVVRDGDHVEIVGRVRRREVAHEETPAHQRLAPSTTTTTLEIVGSADTPVLVEQRRSTHARVRVESDEASEADEALSLDRAETRRHR